MGTQSWISCHCCSRKPSDEYKIFFITQCEVLLCAPCKERLCRKECIKCKTKCNYFEVNKNLPSNLKILFQDPVEFARDSVIKLKQMLKYQSEQKSSYEKCLSKKWQRVGQTVKIATAKRKSPSADGLGELMKENKLLKLELQRLMQLEHSLNARGDESADFFEFCKDKTDTDSGLGSDSSFTFITSTPKLEPKGSLPGGTLPFISNFFRDGLVISPICNGVKRA